jgi:hypothetical protein
LCEARTVGIEDAGGVEFACGPSGALGGVPVEIEEARACIDWSGLFLNCGLLTSGCRCLRLDLRCNHSGLGRGEQGQGREGAGRRIRTIRRRIPLPRLLRVLRIRRLIPL